jgi:hypothetical protein
MNGITITQIREITDLAGGPVPTATYSGRGMFGQQCVGWDCDTITQILRLGAAIMSIMGDDAPDMVTDASTDSMGLGTIVYFPRWQAIGGQLDEYNEEDDDE